MPAVFPLQNEYAQMSRYPLAGGAYCNGNSAGPTKGFDPYRSSSTKTNRPATTAFPPGALRMSASVFRRRRRVPPARLAVPVALAPPQPVGAPVVAPLAAARIPRSLLARLATSRGTPTPWRRQVNE